MIPKTNSTVNLVTFQSQNMPSRAYNLGLATQHGGGFIDQREAMRQAIYLILNTERYEYPIYAWNYGVELGDLIGQPIPFVLPEIKRRIAEALEQDDRIISVDNWEFDVKHGKVTATFVVHTIFGDLPIEQEVGI